MSIEHKYPIGFMTREQQQRLDELMSDTMELFFELEKRGVEDAQSVLMRGTTFDKTSFNTGHSS